MSAAARTQTAKRVRQAGYDQSVTVKFKPEVVRIVDDLARAQGVSRAGIWRELVDQGYRIAAPEDPVGLRLPIHKQRASPKPLRIVMGRPARPVVQHGLFEGFDVCEVRRGPKPTGEIKNQVVGLMLPAPALEKIENWGEAHCLIGRAAAIKRLIGLALERRCPSVEALA